MLTVTPLKFWPLTLRASLKAYGFVKRESPVADSICLFGVLRKNKQYQSGRVYACNLQVLPLVKEANLIAQELGKPYELKPKLHMGITRRGKRTEVVIGVHYKGVEVYTWHSTVLENRIYLMRDLFDKWLDAANKNAFVAGKRPLSKGWGMPRPVVGGYH